jgi:alpha-D-ribose 1-methylphosphonate 5-triphosphate synthase subunit PhnG
MKSRRSSLQTVIAVIAGLSMTTGFAPLTLTRPSTRLAYSSDSDGSNSGSGSDKKQDAQLHAQSILDRLAQVRAEIAAMEGKSVDQVTQEAQQKKDSLARRQQEALERQQAAPKMDRRPMTSLSVPNTAAEQVQQAAAAVERAFKDGINRQIVHFTLLHQDDVLYNTIDDNSWPGGARQMYREAAKPMTIDLLSQVRAPTGHLVQEALDQGLREHSQLRYKGQVTAQDVWDFDGSGVVSAHAHVGPAADVQALVQPNTDVKYLKDVATMDQAMKDRLLLLVNPFWKNVDSWGMNLLAPGAKKKAQETIFDRGFQQTYVLKQLSVRGEDCVALKAYPYDWQLFAYIESDSPYENVPTLIRLGTTTDEPTVKDFAGMIQERPEFQLTKTMRQMQRTLGRK